MLVPTIDVHPSPDGESIRQSIFYSPTNLQAVLRLRPLRRTESMSLTAKLVQLADTEILWNCSILKLRSKSVTCKQNWQMILHNLLCCDHSSSSDLVTNIWNIYPILGLMYTCIHEVWTSTPLACWTIQLHQNSDTLSWASKLFLLPLCLKFFILEHEFRRIQTSCA